MKFVAQERVTKTDLESVSNLVEDHCVEPNCGMTILVDKDLKQQGRKSRCTACLMRLKLSK